MIHDKLVFRKQTPWPDSCKQARLLYYMNRCLPLHPDTTLVCISFVWLWLWNDCTFDPVAIPYCEQSTLIHFFTTQYSLIHCATDGSYRLYLRHLGVIFLLDNWKTDCSHNTKSRTIVRFVNSRLINFLRSVDKCDKYNIDFYQILASSWELLVVHPRRSWLSWNDSKLCSIPFQKAHWDQSINQGNNTKNTLI